jgi:hypothetical protein
LHVDAQLFSVPGLFHALYVQSCSSVCVA